MSDYRAPCIWAVRYSPSPYGDYIAADQYGGFSGRHRHAQEAIDWINEEIARNPGDAWAETE